MSVYLLQVVWDPDKVAFTLFGHEVVWYGVCWVIGLALSYFVVQRLFKDQQIPEEKFDPLFL